MTDTCNLRTHSEQRFCCGGCHRAFSSMEVFDHHRAGRKCVDPATCVDEKGRSRGYIARLTDGIIGKVEVWGGPGAPEFTPRRPPRKTAQASAVAAIDTDDSG